MARFILHTDENHDRQHQLISHFYPEVIRAYRPNEVVIWTLWGKRQNRVVGRSEKYKDNRIYLLTLHIEFLTLSLSSPTIHDIIRTLQFRIVSNKCVGSLVKPVNI